MSGLGALANFALPQGGGQIDYLVAIINSRLVQDAVIEKFNLKLRYKTEAIEDTREALKGHTVIVRNVLAEIVSIGSDDEDPKVAADLTNSFVDLLNKAYTDLNSQVGKNSREHLEIRYNQTKLYLSTLEDSLRTFEEKYGVYNITAQTEAAIKSAASLKSEITLKEIELGVKEKMFDSEAPDIVRLKLETAQMNKSFDEMIHGDDKKLSENIFIPFAKAPSLGLVYLRLFREIEIQTELVKVLLPLLEQARLQEKRETPSLLVIDRGMVPEKKSKPFRSLIVLIGFVAFLSVSCVAVMMVEHLQNVKVKNPERYGKIEMIYNTIIVDLQVSAQKGIIF